VEAEQLSKYRLAYSQNVNGIISFSGSVHFDDIKENRHEILNLLATLSQAELEFKKSGYELAINNKPKAKTK
jgi:hypothetical protein